MSGKKLDKLRHAEVTSEENGCCYFLNEFKNDKISDILYCYIVLLYMLLYSLDIIQTGNMNKSDKHINNNNLKMYEKTNLEWI